MQASMFAVAGVYWRLWRINIPGSADARGPVDLRSLVRASADFQGLDEQVLQKPDLILGTKVTDFSGDVNFLGPSTDGVTRSVLTAVRPWAAAKGDWTENCTQLLTTTWVIAQGAPVVNANLIAYLRGAPLKVNQ